MKRSCMSCDYATRLDKHAMPIYGEEKTIVLGIYCALIRENFLITAAPEDCPEWDEAGKERYPKL